MPIPPQPVLLDPCVSADELFVEFLGALFTGVITADSNIVVDSI